MIQLLKELGNKQDDHMLEEAGDRVHNLIIDVRDLEVLTLGQCTEFVVNGT